MEGGERRDDEEGRDRERGGGVRAIVWLDHYTMCVIVFINGKCGCGGEGFLTVHFGLCLLGP